MSETNLPKEKTEKKSGGQFFYWLAFVAALHFNCVLWYPYIGSLTASIVVQRISSGIQVEFETPTTISSVSFTASSVPDTYGFTDCDVIVETSGDAVSWTLFEKRHYESVSGSGTFTIACGETAQHLRVRLEGKYHNNSFDVIRIDALADEILHNKATEAIFVPGGIEIGNIWVGTGTAVAEVWDSKTDTKVFPRAE